MNVTIEQLKNKFNENAPNYDQQRKKLIPCFEDFYTIPITLLDTAKDAPDVLDIGAGTGLFASFVKEKYPSAKLTLVDISEKMITHAKERFKNDGNTNYVIADYTKYNFNQKFDFVISSLSIHHLTDEEKRNLYNNIFQLLNDNGIFINADQVLGQTPFIEELYKNDWKYKIENSGLLEEEIQSAYERTKLDKMATLKDQLKWLTEAGFQEVDCVYKYFNFVVLFAKKQEK